MNLFISVLKKMFFGLSSYLSKSIDTIKREGGLDLNLKIGRTPFLPDLLLRFGRFTSSVTDILPERKPFKLRTLCL